MLIQSSKIKLEWLQTTKSKGLSPELKKDLENLLNAFEKEFKFKGITQIEIALTLCGKEKIKSLNWIHRKKDKVTDVLSFPVHESFYKSKGNFFGLMEFGDIFICHDVAQRQAKEFGITFREEIIHLFVHGFLHLLGYDHEISKKEEKIMFDLEKKLISKIGKRNG